MKVLAHTCLWCEDVSAVLVFLFCSLGICSDTLIFIFERVFIRMWKRCNAVESFTVSFEDEETSDHILDKVTLRLDDLGVPAHQGKGGDLDHSESKWDFVAVKNTCMTTQRSGRHPEMQERDARRCKRMERDPHLRICRVTN